MKTHLLIALISVLAFSACRQKKEVANVTVISATEESNTAAVPVPDGLPNEINVAVENMVIDTLKSYNYRFVISFYSIGEGRDEESRRKFLMYLDSYRAEHNKTIIAEGTPWGREGEVDYCMKLNELNAREQQDFIEKTRSLLSNAKWVHFYENRPCRHKE